MTSLKEELNILIGKYGIQAVHKSLNDKMEAEYTYLKSIFGKKDKEKEKEKEKEEIISLSVSTLEDEDENENEENSNAIVVVKEESKEIKEKTYRDPKEMKLWQKAQEEKKKAENDAKGITSKSLLTKENLQKWYGEEGKTFSYISREYVGCKDTEVSAAVKFFGIENTHKKVFINNYKKK